ncbi:MAG: hypothetical protein ABI193_05825 [Minicystis sp.]
MGKNIIVSEETLRDLLEAHASLSAWYYELWSGLRAANATARTPDDAARAAFVERLATDFPEIAAVARSIRVPRLYVPAPPPVIGKAPTPPPDDIPLPPTDEPATLIEPAPARLKERFTSEVPPPALVPKDTKKSVN